MADSGADKNLKLRTAKSAAAALVIKGALMNMFNTAITVGNKYESRTKGRVIVAYSGAKPSDTDLKKLQTLVNQCIAAGKPIEVTEKDRKEAETYYLKNPINGQYIYEKKEPPAAITNLTIATIPEWTVSVSPSKEFVSNTSEIGGVEILRFNHRDTKQELEVCFQLNEGESSAESEQASNSATGSSSTANQTKPNGSTNSSSTKAIITRGDNIEAVAESMLMNFVEALKRTRPDIALSDAELASLRRNASIQSNVILTTLKNQAYATGYTSRLSQ